MASATMPIEPAHAAPAGPNTSANTNVPISMGATSAAVQDWDGRKLVDHLLNDFRTLSTEAKKKYNHVKEAAETAVVKIRNTSSASQPETLLTNMRMACADILHPLMVACASKNPRLVQISLQTVQRMLQFGMMDVGSASIVVNELWQLTEAECEELRILQTITPLVGAEPWLVEDWTLARCIVLAVRLNFSKDPSVINAANASLRQLFSSVFERVLQEDGKGATPTSAKANGPSGHSPTLLLRDKLAPSTLRPAAADAYLLLKDLIWLIRRDTPQWLNGVKRIATNLALELLESVLKHYPSLFFKHEEYRELLRREICPLVVKLFAGENDARLIGQRLSTAAAGGTIPNSLGADGSAGEKGNGALPHHHHPVQTYANGHSSPANFPLVMRALRISLVLVVNYHSLLTPAQNELLFTFMLELLSAPLTPALQWQSAMALEVLHRIVAQPLLLAWMCTEFDCRQPDATKLLNTTVARLAEFVGRALAEGPHSFAPQEGGGGWAGGVGREGGDDLSMSGGEGPTGKDDGREGGRQGFVYRGRFIPLQGGCSGSTRKWMLLEWLEKHEAGSIPDGYCLSLAYACLIDCTRSVFTCVEDNQSSLDTPAKRQLLLSTYSPLLDGLSLLLEYSVEDTLSECLLNCLSTLVLLACRLEVNEARSAALKALCTAALPLAYFKSYVDPSLPHSPLRGVNASATTASNHHPEVKGGGEEGKPPPKEEQQVLSHVVAMGFPCPTPASQQLSNTAVVLTAKNMQAAKVLITAAQTNGQLLTHCWDVVLASLQHLVWILGMRPTSSGSLRAGGEQAPNKDSTPSAGGATANTTILTTAMSGELPELDAAMSKLFESTASYDDVSLHHVIAALCRLSAEAMTVAHATLKEPSFFPVAKLMQSAMANLYRLPTFWKPVTAHLLEVCAHTNAKLREWGTIALTSLIRNSIKSPLHQPSPTSFDKENSSSGGQQNPQQLVQQRDLAILTPLAKMSELGFHDAKARQLDCLMRILQSDNGHPLDQQLWPLVIGIAAAIVDMVADGAQLEEGSVAVEGSGGKEDAQLIEQGYQIVSLIVKEFISSLPFDSMLMLAVVDAGYGKQQTHLNVSLAAVGQLWDIADFVRRDAARRDSKQLEQLWLSLYTSLGELCTDPRPPVRKSARDTLLQSVAAHGHALSATTWDQMVSRILFPMLAAVRRETLAASTRPSGASSSGGATSTSIVIMHHSRDTESKQWAETTVKTLGGVVKIFNSQRGTLMALAAFPQYWSRLLEFVEMTAAADNSEMSLAALKNFHELLFGRPPTSEGYTGHRKANDSNTSSTTSDLIDSSSPAIRQLPDKIWLMSWRCWLRLASITVSPVTTLVTTSEKEANDSGSPGSAGVRKHYVPGAFHLTTLLNTFPPLLKRVHRSVEPDEFRGNYLPHILREAVAIPFTPDPIQMIPYFSATATSSENAMVPLNPTQESVLECVRTLLKEQLVVDSVLRPALPDTLRLLLEFAGYAIRPPISAMGGNGQQSTNAMLMQDGSDGADGGENHAAAVKQQQIEAGSMINFAELSLKMAVDNYIKAATYPEVLRETVLVDAIKALAEPLSLKYHCPSQTTWKLASTSLINICKVGLPLARQHRQLFTQLWLRLADAMEGFLFSRSRPHLPLNADERKRHEYVDCLVVELMRAEVLPYAQQLPPDFMQRIIDILNRGSINTSDHSDMLASDSNQQRADLSRVCFDALLSMSRSQGEGENPNELASALNRSPTTVAGSMRLGESAISSLLNRCKQVLNDYARDETSSGHFRLPQERIVETVAVLRAISTLIEGLARHPHLAKGGSGSGNEAGQDAAGGGADFHSAPLYVHLVAIYPSLVQLIPSCRGDQQVELALMTALNSYQTMLLMNIHKRS